jgi:phospholipase C
VLLLLENHSFDEMLGCFQQLYPEVDGVDPSQPPRWNEDPSGKKIYQQEKTSHFLVDDPKHECKNVADQLKNANGGFVEDFVATYPSATDDERAQIMGYYKLGFLPALHALAKDFTICDRWFSSLPGPTWPNRFFALSGTSSGCVFMPDGFFHQNLSTIRAQVQLTIFDRLSERGKRWAVYYYDFPCSLIFKSMRKPANTTHYERIDRFFEEAAEDAANFPDFCFIEPKYFGVDQNDDHPPHNVMKAEKLIADVYNAIRSNEKLWNSTLLVVAFDEHGGFYDHVVPKPALPPGRQQAGVQLRPVRNPRPSLTCVALGRETRGSHRIRPHELPQIFDRQVGPWPTGSAHRCRKFDRRGDQPAVSAQGYSRGHTSAIQRAHCGGLYKRG